MKTLALITFFSILEGCADTGNNLTQIEKSINIIAVLPIKVQVNNSHAQFARSVSGAVTRGLGNRFGGMGSLGIAGTSLDDGAIGTSTGYMMPEKISVDGVSITYSEHEKTFNSKQVGRVCEFKQGVTILKTTANETMIQPNATCLEEK